MKKLLTLGFLPISPDLGLLVLRVWLGASMFFLHGLDKLKNFNDRMEGFAKGGFHPVLGGGAVIAESICAILLMIGLATRISATLLAGTMAVAFFVFHKGYLIAPNPPPADFKGVGELAFIYLAGFVTILIAGPGKFSVDGKALK